MAVTQNLKGTSYPSFKIHKSGPTLYQGSVSPSVGNPASPRNGDLYMQHGTSGRLWIYGSGSWSEIETGLNDALDSFTLRSTYVPEAKNIQYILTGTSTDANEIELLIQTTLSADTTLIDVTNTTIDGSTTITSGRINIPDDTTGIVEAKIVARDSDNNENAGYIIKGVVVNDSGSTVLLTDPMEEILGESTSSWYALIEANDTTDSVVVKASGSANATIKWTAFVNVTLAYSTPQYSLSSNTNSVSEGQSVTYTLTTRSITDGTTVPYTITGIDQADLSAGNLTGNFTVTNNTATLTFTLAEDATTEGTENMTLALDNGLASADVVVVSDTSGGGSTPSYTATSDISSVIGSENLQQMYFAQNGSQLLTGSWTSQSGGGGLRSWTLSTPYDITSISSSADATVNWNTYNDYISSGSTRWINGGHFNNDGTILFIGSLNWLFAYDLSTPYDISTASWKGNTNGFFETTAPTNSEITTYGLDIFTFQVPESFKCYNFNTDGTKLIAFDYEKKALESYDLSTAWDISSSSVGSRVWYAIQSDTIDGISSSYGRHITFNDDGTKMYLAVDKTANDPGDTDYIFVYTLSSAWDITTLTPDSKFDITSLIPAGSSSNTTTYSIQFANNNLYVVDNAGTNSGKIHQISL